MGSSASSSESKTESKTEITQEVEITDNSWHYTDNSKQFTDTSYTDNSKLYTNRASIDQSQDVSTSVQQKTDIETTQFVRDGQEFIGTSRAVALGSGNYVDSSYRATFEGKQTGDVNTIFRPETGIIAGGRTASQYDTTAGFDFGGTFFTGPSADFGQTVSLDQREQIAMQESEPVTEQAAGATALSASGFGTGTGMGLGAGIVSAPGGGAAFGSIIVILIILAAVGVGAYFLITAATKKQRY